MNTRPLLDCEAKNLAALNTSGFNSVLLFVTATALDKSILDATEPMRNLLKIAGIHDYQAQGKGVGNKVFKQSVILGDLLNSPAKVSLYRPSTKNGDPRFWFYDFKKFVSAGEVCAVFVQSGIIYVLNLSRSKAAQAVASGTETPVSRFLLDAGTAANANATELLLLLTEIAAAGPLKAVCMGDTAIGRSIETALGIQINSSRNPDFKGIELKSGRSTILSKETRATLFACVPDWSLSALKSSRALLERFGYEREGNFKLYCSVTTRRANSQGLRLRLEDAFARLHEYYAHEPEEDVCIWNMDNLHSRLTEKHRETFWVKAKSIQRSGSEWFELQSVTHTSRPSMEQFDRLLLDGTVTLDHLIKRTPSGGAHERGPLFKVERQRLPELFLGEPRHYTLVT
ncbi:MAG: MvaI/BcnI restriction endonuclease family protein [Verrucomicrobia bacterium]|nr:MAG: MvaI/BcnI restriction endonuclease family protein [Verrucomicrobiota bacterium]